MKFSVLVLVSLFIAGSTFANEVEITEELVLDVASVGIDHGDFLGCVSSRHECRHEAENHGYHHSRAIRDLYTCHHDHHAQFACYGIQ